MTTLPVTNSVLLFVFLWAKGLKANDIHSLQHPPYSPDLAPSDYHLFGPMKKMLGGQKFASDAEVQSVVHQWLGQQPASFFASGIQKLVDRWDKCLNELGRYAKNEILMFNIQRGNINLLSLFVFLSHSSAVYREL